MPSEISGPALDKIVAEAKEWYIQTKEFLIKAMLTGGYPYGAVRLTPAQQYAKFRAMTPQDWQALEGTLLNVFKGRPDAPFQVERAMAGYVRLMTNLGRVYGGQVGRIAANTAPNAVPIEGL